MSKYLKWHELSIHFKLLYLIRQTMASYLQTKPLNELSEDEVAALLVEKKFGNIKEKLFSGEFGEINGEMIAGLEDEDLKSEFGISSGLQRKNFINKMKTYKEEGVPLELLPANIHPQTPVDRSLLEKLLKKSEKIKHECTPEMDILAFPSKKVRVSELKSPTQGNNLKKIIIMGETGTGKSTLLNAFVNFAAGVEMKDPFRFKLVVDESGQSHDQTKSQTTEISGYLIEDTELGFSLQIWDTPGFGDIGGLERDEKIKDQINELLKIEDECHAICFVVKANVNRLTDIQKYIIDRVLLFFGKEALENIYTLATFADANRPDVLSAIQQSSLPFDEKRWFKFNNRALFTTASERTKSSKSYWDIVNISIAKFFHTLQQLTAFSLTSTKEVIREREEIQINISAMKNEIDKAIQISHNTEENLRKLEAEKDQVERTQNFTKSVITHKKYPIPTKNTTTFCVQCTYTCHDDCSCKDDSDKRNCSAMTDGYCQVCPKKCKWDWHKNQPYIYVDETITSEVVIHDVKEKHDNAIKNVSAYQTFKNHFENEKQKAEASLWKLMTAIKFQTDKLKNIAIQSNSVDMSKYFQTLIETEKKRGNIEKALEYEKLAKDELTKIESGNLKVEELVNKFSKSKI